MQLIRNADTFNCNYKIIVILKKNAIKNKSLRVVAASYINSIGLKDGNIKTQFQLRSPWKHFYSCNIHQLFAFLLS